MVRRTPISWSVISGMGRALLVLLHKSLFPFDLFLLLLALLLLEVLLVIFSILVRVVVVGFCVGLRKADGGLAEAYREEQETDASRFHGLTWEELVWRNRTPSKWFSSAVFPVACFPRELLRSEVSVGS